MLLRYTVRASEVGFHMLLPSHSILCFLAGARIEEELQHSSVVINTGPDERRVAILPQK